MFRSGHLRRKGQPIEGLAGEDRQWAANEDRQWAAQNIFNKYLVDHRILPVLIIQRRLLFGKN